MKDVIESPVLEAIENQAENNLRESRVKIVRRWGGLASDAVLDPNSEIFEIPNLDGILGYRIEHGCAVVYGNPVCAPAMASKLVEAFDHYTKKLGLKVLYVGATGWFAEAVIQSGQGVSIEFGYEITLNPQRDPRSHTGSHGSLVRRKVRHAEKEGVCVEEYTEADSALEVALEEVGNSWLQMRKGPQVHISHVHLFDDRPGKRWFYAKKEDQIVGVVVLNQLEARQGWLLNHLMFTPQAPNGTPEILVVTALAKIAEEGCHFVSFGNASKASLEIMGLGKFSSWAITHIFKLATHIFHLEGHIKFWDKFHPQYEPSYILFRERNIGIRQILSLMKALNLKWRN